MNHRKWLSFMVACSLVPPPAQAGNRCACSAGSDCAPPSPVDLPPRVARLAAALAHPSADIRPDGGALAAVFPTSGGEGGVEWKPTFDSADGGTLAHNNSIPYCDRAEETPPANDGMACDRAAFQIHPDGSITSIYDDNGPQACGVVQGSYCLVASPLWGAAIYVRARNGSQEDSQAQCFNATPGVVYSAPSAVDTRNPVLSLQVFAAPPADTAARLRSAATATVSAALSTAVQAWVLGGWAKQLQASATRGAKEPTKVPPTAAALLDCYDSPLRAIAASLPSEEVVGKALGAAVDTIKANLPQIEGAQGDSYCYSAADWRRVLETVGDGAYDEQRTPRPVAALLKDLDDDADKAQAALLGLALAYQEPLDTVFPWPLLAVTLPGNATGWRVIAVQSQTGRHSYEAIGGRKLVADDKPLLFASGLRRGDPPAPAAGDAAKKRADGFPPFEASVFFKGSAIASKPSDLAVAFGKAIQVVAKLGGGSPKLTTTGSSKLCDEEVPDLKPASVAVHVPCSLTSACEEVLSAGPDGAVDQCAFAHPASELKLKGWRDLCHALKEKDALRALLAARQLHVDASDYFVKIRSESLDAQRLSKVIRPQVSAAFDESRKDLGTRSNLAPKAREACLAALSNAEEKAIKDGPAMVVDENRQRARDELDEQAKTFLRFVGKGLPALRSAPPAASITARAFRSDPVVGDFIHVLRVCKPSVACKADTADDDLSTEAAVHVFSKHRIFSTATELSADLPPDLLHSGHPAYGGYRFDPISTTSGTQSYYQLRAHTDSSSYFGVNQLLVLYPLVRLESQTSFTDSLYIGAGPTLLRGDQIGFLTQWNFRLGFEVANGALLGIGASVRGIQAPTALPVGTVVAVDSGKPAPDFAKEQRFNWTFSLGLAVDLAILPDLGKSIVGGGAGTTTPAATATGADDKKGGK